MDRPRVYGEAWRDCSEQEAGGREKAASGQAERTPGSDEGPGIMQVLEELGTERGGARRKAAATESTSVTVPVLSEQLLRVSWACILSGQG